MIELRDKVTNEPLGTIDDSELRFLIDELQEESETDRDYYFDADTIDKLEADCPRVTQLKEWDSSNPP